MDLTTPLLGDSLDEPHRLSSFSSGSANQTTRKRPPLRIIVPPVEYCPFSTDLTLPATPLSLPTPVSSSCFTFNDSQGLTNQNMSAPPVLLSCPRVATVTGFASPTSSQFLLMPPTPRLENVDSETAICTSPLTTPGGTNELMCRESHGTKFKNLRPWQVSSSTWLSDLGGHTETDRIFRHNLGITSADTASSPASTPALSPSALSPSSQVSSILVHTSPTSLARSPPALSQRLSAMSSQPSSLARLVLKPTGTDTFPSTLDGVHAWRESVMPGLPGSEEPLSEDVHDSQLAQPMPETPNDPSLPSHQLHSPLFPPRVGRLSRSQTFIQHARMFGGRVKRLVTRQNANKYRGSMDRGVNFRIVTSQDSENGSVILITAPPPPYDARPPTRTSCTSVEQEHVRSRTISEYSSAVQPSVVECATTGVTELSSRQGNNNRNTLRRLSFATLSTIKRF